MSKPPYLRTIDGDGTPPDKPPACNIADQIRAIAEKAIAQGAIAFCAIWENPKNTDMDSAPQSEMVERGALTILRSSMQERYGSESDDG